jgi:hypothetical protein
MQPLFIEVIDNSNAKPVIIGLAHIRRIDRTQDNRANISLGDEDGNDFVITVETFEMIRAALGVVVRPK